ncbi:hypothetical protein ACK249_006950 [Pseudomonas aeruginosa]
MTERSGGNGAVAVFMACYDCFFVQSMPRASKQQARYAVGRCLMLWSSNDVTQQGSRPKTKLCAFSKTHQVHQNFFLAGRIAYFELAPFKMPF